MLKLSSWFLTLSILFLFLAACEDDMENIASDPDQNVGDPSGGSPFDCTQFAYADTIFYLQNQVGDYIVSPLNTLEGKFGASPRGMVIDSISGDINVSLSETGLKYEVFFVPQNSTDTCLTTVTISGIDYESKVHLIEQNDTLSVPIYNGSRLAALPCDDDDDDDDDDNDDDDCGFDTDGTASSLGLAINSTNGAINLKQTVLNEAFGSIPVSGDSLDATINYQLNDASNGVPNSIAVRLFYFEDLASVPQDLLEAVEDRSIQYEEGARKSRALKNARTLRRGGGGGRPPYILIVGRAI